MQIITIFRAVFVLNIAFYVITGWMTGSLISSGAVTAARPFSWEDDWDLLTILMLLAILNGLGMVFTILRPEAR